MAWQIIEQLNVWTHSHNHLHLDIKPTNIMRKMNTNQQHCEYTLIDFEFSMETGCEYNGYLGTAEWSAPEMKPGNKAQNVIHESTDMWSVGLVVIYCLFGGHQPFCYEGKERK